MDRVEAEGAVAREVLGFAFDQVHAQVRVGAVDPQSRLAATLVLADAHDADPEPGEVRLGPLSGSHGVGG